MLVKLLTSWTVLLQGSSDSFDSVRGLGRRIEVLPKKVALYFYCKGSVVLLSTEGVFCISIGCYNTAMFRHLELKVGIVRHRIETGKCGSFEQCVITTAEGDDIEE